MDFLKAFLKAETVSPLFDQALKACHSRVEMLGKDRLLLKPEALSSRSKEEAEGGPSPFQGGPKH